MKNPRVISVNPASNYILNIVFENGEAKNFDVKPYLKYGIFSELNDPIYFKNVKPFLGTVHWPNGQDFCPDTLYMESEK